MSRSPTLCGAMIMLLLAATMAAPAEAATPSPPQRLAGQFVRAARYLLTINPLTVEALDGAVILIEEATDLDQNNPETWRLAAEIAALAERDILQRRAVERIVELDPDDQVARLQLISLQLDEHQTVEARVEAYERWLDPANRSHLNPAVASRLALDLALLERRRGNISAFTDWLAEAVALDSANRAAVSIAAGYFRVNVDDPYAEAELLVALLLAAPTDITTQAVLGAHLLSHGAYTGADRMYSLAIDSYAGAESRPPSDLVADLAIARWGRGDLQSALQAIRVHQAWADERHRMRLREENPDLTPLERAREYAVMTPILATVAAALQSELSPDGGQEFAFRRVAEAYDVMIQHVRDATDLTEDQRQQRLAELHLELAFTTLWLNGEIDRAREAIGAATAARPISDVARARFDGWIALREGDAQRAADLLEPHAEEDPAAQLGLAVAWQSLGQTRNAARQYLAVARGQRGTLLGVWAADRLATLLGQRVALDDIARRLEALIAEIGTTMDRFPSQPNSAVSIRVTSSKPTFGPYEPLIVNIEISNNSKLPLAIDRAGPIRPEIALLPSIQIARAGSANAPPVIVSINRRLRLMPRERLTIPVDLRRTQTGALLESYPVPGAMVGVRGVMNFTVTPQRAIRPGLLGSEHESAPIRVDGVRVSEAWVESTLAALAQTDNTPDLDRLALLGQLARSRPTAGVTDERWAMIRDSRALLAERFAQLNPVSQAWLLTVLPDVEALEATSAIARKSEDRLVRLAQLAFRVNQTDDPMIDAALRSDDPTLRRFAEVVRHVFERAEAERESSESLVPAPATVAPPSASGRGPGG